MQFLFNFRGCDVHVSDKAWTEMNTKKSSLPIYQNMPSLELLRIVHDLQGKQIKHVLLFAETMSIAAVKAMAAHLNSLKAFDKAAQAKFAATGQWPASALNSLPSDGRNASLTVDEIFDFSTVGMGLQKYFHLAFADPAYQERVQRVADVFQKVRDRFTVGFKLELMTSSEVTGWNGRAFPSKLGDRNSIRAFFGDPDLQYHEPRQYVIEYAKMQLPIDYVAFSEPDALARTIVHEMSHIAALTEDVLYKHESFAKNENERVTPDGKMSQIGITVPGRAKPLMPMAGIERDRASKGARGVNLIDSSSYVHNADSYAWFARRMMKANNASTYQKFSHPVVVI